jgi:hypothetical protein
MNELEKIKPEEFGLQESEVVIIEQAFMPKIVERDALKTVYEDLLIQEITPELCQKAKSLRLKLVKIRTGIAEIHKSQKAYFLAAGKFVDAWKNKEMLPVTEMEENLEAIEQHYARIEAEKIKALQEERASEMQKFEADFIPSNLGELTDQVWQNFILGTKVAYEQKKEGERLRIEAEEKRIADEKVEQERIRLENERLKNEALAREKELEKERAKAAEEKRKADKALAAEQELARKAAQKAAEEKAALERELAAKAAEEKRKADEAEANLQAELLKGDSDKFNDLIHDLENLKTKYTFKSEKNKTKYTDVGILLEKIINHIK